MYFAHQVIFDHARERSILLVLILLNRVLRNICNVIFDNAEIYFVLYFQSTEFLLFGRVRIFTGPMPPMLLTAAF